MLKPDVFYTYRDDHDVVKERKRGFRRLLGGMVSSIRNVITGVIPIEAPIPLADCVAARGKTILYLLSKQSPKALRCR